MSKSKNNVVEPGEVIARYGADTARFFSMFAGPPEQSAVYSDAGIEGAHRFLRRLWSYCHAQRKAASDAPPLDARNLGPEMQAVRRLVHLALQQADFDYQRLQYNTVVSACMKMLNALEEGIPARAAPDAQRRAVLRESLGILLRVLAPITPHITHEIWNALAFVATDGPLLEVAWPKPDAAALIQDTIEIVVQVNGKLRGKVSVAQSSDEATVREAALGDLNVRKFLGDKPVRKVIFVPGKLVNLVA